MLKAFGFAVDALGIRRQTAFGVDIGCSLLPIETGSAFDVVNQLQGQARAGFA